MDKADLLAKIAEFAHSGQLTEQEVVDAFRGSSGGSSRWLSPTLGFVGSALVAAAVLIFINTQRVGAGYGAVISGIIAGLAYALGALNARSENGKPFSEPLLFMAGLVVPMLLVFGSIDLGYDPLAVGLQAVLGGIGFVPFLATGLGLKSSTSIVLASFFAGWGITALCAWVG
ncbi:MAG: hypothetical protein H0W86_10410, partial [Armatimonadetes bacterium]|nr:hypothetical protein [Armatimonadota bacterium]